MDEVPTMTDEDWERGRENIQDLTGESESGNFARAIARVSVTQICESVGFESCQVSALDALSDIVLRYICDLGKSAHFYANLAGRTDCNYFDIAKGLEDLSFSHSFSDSQEITHSNFASEVPREIATYINLGEEIPFSHPLPCFPLIIKRKSTPSFSQHGENPPSKHIPSWLPAFPDPHTYIHTPIWNERATDPRTDKLEQARQRRKAERSLLSLQQKLAVNSHPPTLISYYEVDESALILTKVLPNGENKTNSLALTVGSSNDSIGENRVSVLETFSPAIEAARKGFCDFGDVEGTGAFPNKRPIVHFKLGIGKKTLGEPLDLSLQKKGSGDVVLASWAARDEKDDKKRRVEQILKESMENPHELAQL